MKLSNDSEYRFEKIAQIIMKPRNFVAKNSPSVGAGPHKDKKRAAKNGDHKHKEKQMRDQDWGSKTQKIPRA